MAIRSVFHLSDPELWRNADSLETQERTAMAQLLVCIAELDSRKLWAVEGHQSMQACCVERWKMSDDMACKRITVARKGRRFPAIFSGLADGRFHLSGLVLVVPHLVESNADDLLADAANKTRREIELVIARRFPKDDVPTVLVPVAAAPMTTSAQLPAPGRVGAKSTSSNPRIDRSMTDTSAESSRVDLGPDSIRAGAASVPVVDSGAAPATLTGVLTYPRVAPLAPERFALQLTIDQETHDLLRKAQALSNATAQAELPDLLKRALAMYVKKLEARKFGVTSKQRKKQRRVTLDRTIPAVVRDVVSSRDGYRCTYVSDVGRRCSACSALQFDHIVPVARGGESTPSNLRLRCRPHNQLEAERVFGAAFMEFKREQARNQRRDATAPSAPTGT